MVAYEFYMRNEVKGVNLIGILPERREKPERITKESVMNWVKQILGDEIDVSNIFFVQVTVDNITGEIF